MRSASSPAGIARQRVHQVVSDVGQDHLDDREADLVEPQQQQRVGKVHDAERDQQAATRQYRPGRSRTRAKIAAALRGHDAAGLPHQEHQRDAQHRGDDGHPQQRRDLVVEQFVAGKAEQRSDHRADGVHRPVEAEHPAAGGIVDVLDQQRIPRRAADSLAEPVDHPARQHARPCAEAAATITLPSAAMP